MLLRFFTNFGIHCLITTYTPYFLAPRVHTCAGSCLSSCSAVPDPPVKLTVRVSLVMPCALMRDEKGRCLVHSPSLLSAIATCALAVSDEPTCEMVTVSAITSNQLYRFQLIADAGVIRQLLWRPPENHVSALKIDCTRLASCNWLAPLGVKIPFPLIVNTLILWICDYSL